MRATRAVDNLPHLALRLADQRYRVLLTPKARRLARPGVSDGRLERVRLAVFEGLRGAGVVISLLEVYIGVQAVIS